MVSVGKECMQTLLSAQYVKSGFTGGVHHDYFLIGRILIHKNSTTKT